MNKGFGEGGAGGGGGRAISVEGSWGSRGQLVGKGALGMGLEPALQALGVSLEEGLGVGERLARSGLCDTWVASGGAGGGAGNSQNGLEGPRGKHRPMEGTPGNSVLRCESLATAVVEIEKLVRKA